MMKASFLAIVIGITSAICTIADDHAASQPDMRITEAKAAHQGPAWDFSHGDLKVGEDGHFLVHEDGTAFLYLGDTAWELFHRLNREEVELFLEKRRSQGFTVIQAVALAEFGGLTRPNPYGHTPLLNNNPETPDVKDGPNNDYWDHVDFVVETAAKKGLYIGFLPTWGDKMTKIWGEGPEIFNEKNAAQYGEFLGKRYANAPNIIWILGGDRPAEHDGKDYRPIWRAMADGIRKGDHHKHLQTYHPMGGYSSSQWLHGETWLDFNMQQSGHGEKNAPSYKKIFEDYCRKPVKPVLDGEPRYDNHPVRNDKEKHLWFDDFDVRQAAYWGIFAGGFGHTYGCHDIWQMYDGTPERRCTDPRTPWMQAVDLPGAWDMLHVRRLLLSRPFLGRTPDQTLLDGGTEDGMGHQQATLGKDGAYAFVYSPTGSTIRLKTDKLSGETLTCSWFNPRTGETQKIGDRKKSEKILELTPPGKTERGNDWVLIVDDTSKGFFGP